MKKLFALSFISLVSFVAPQAGFASADGEAYKKKIEAQVNEVDQYKAKLNEFQKSEKYKPELLTTEQPFEIQVGDPKAPHQVVEYMSLTCTHCKDFHDNTFYPLKKDMIDTGKVFMRIRPFPLNGTAVKAAMILSCIKKEDQLAFMGALFKSQPQWGFVDNEAALIERLKTIAVIGGLNNNEFDACYGDAKKQDEVLMSMKAAAEGLMVDSTPALFVDGTRYLGARDAETFKKAIESMPAGAQKSDEPVKEEDKADEVKD